MFMLGALRCHYNTSISEYTTLIWKAYLPPSFRIMKYSIYAHIVTLLRRLIISAMAAFLIAQVRGLAFF